MANSVHKSKKTSKKLVKKSSKKLVKKSSKKQMKKLSKKSTKKTSKKQMKKSSRKSIRTSRKSIKNTSDYVLLKGGANKFTEAIAKATNLEQFRQAYNQANLDDYLALFSFTGGDKDKAAEQERFKAAPGSILFIMNVLNSPEKKTIIEFLNKSASACAAHIEWFCNNPNMPEISKLVNKEIYDNVKNIRNAGNARSKLLSLISS